MLQTKDAVECLPENCGGTVQGQLKGGTGEIAFVGHFKGPDGYTMEALQASVLPVLLCVQLCAR